MRKKLVFVTLILLIAAVLSGCTGGAVRGASWPGLAADGNTAYLADGALVYAVNLTDGRELWQYPAKANTKQLFYATPVITPDGLVILGSAGTDHILVAIDPKDINTDTQAPTEAWTFTGAKDHWIAAPLIVGDKLFAANSDGNIYVLNLNDGKSTKEAEKVINVGGRLWAQPVTDGKHIFVTSLDHSVMALDAQTYEELWHENLTAAIPGSAVIGTDGMLYVGSLDSHFEKFDPTTGKHETALTTEGWLWSTPVAEGDNIFLADLTGNLYSYNTGTGKNDWSSLQPDGAVTASPLILPDYILFATEAGKTDKDPGNLFAVSRDGKKIVWNVKISGKKSGKIYTTPVIAGDLILVAPLGADGYIYAYTLDGHETPWSPFIPGK